MTLEIVLYRSDEGFAVQAPSLPGCWSQGATQEEAVQNIRVAIGEYLEAADDDEPPNGDGAANCPKPGGGTDLYERLEVREVEVAD